MDASVVAVEEDGPNDDGCYWHEVRAVLDALVSGARYGVKIRLPHAFVMTFMFRRDLSTRGKLKAILRAVSEHARTLGSFALVYKTVLVGLKFLQRKYGKTLEDSLGANALGRVLMSLIGELFLYEAFWILEVLGGSYACLCSVFILFSQQARPPSCSLPSASHHLPFQYPTMEAQHPNMVLHVHGRAGPNTRCMRSLRVPSAGTLCGATIRPLVTRCSFMFPFASWPVCGSVCPCMTTGIGACGIGWLPPWHGRSSCTCGKPRRIRCSRLCARVWTKFMIPNPLSDGNRGVEKISSDPYIVGWVMTVKSNNGSAHNTTTHSAVEWHGA